MIDFDYYYDLQASIHGVEDELRNRTDLTSGDRIKLEAYRRKLINEYDAAAAKDSARYGSGYGFA